MAAARRGFYRPLRDRIWTPAANSAIRTVFGLTSNRSAPAINMMSAWFVGRLAGQDSVTQYRGSSTEWTGRGST